MAHDRWQRIEAIFEGVLAVPDGERQAFLERECGSDVAVRDAVSSLLDADQEVGAFLDDPLLARTDQKTDSATDPGGLSSESKVGNYRILRKIGEGGLSAVYLAVRDDDAFRRRVAVKVIRAGMESRESLRRLRTERQILAGLDHPYIARLYDGGALENNVPYFVMEYIDGVPVDVFCAQKQLDIRRRVELFRKVCEAVHYAHQNLVVHRDLKPSNILVTADGTPKLLDFGIAKLLNPELSSPDFEVTRTWLRLLTPNYASPEQIRGGSITTTTDVYSLGVLLYRLLTGHLPYRFKEGSPREIERVLTESNPPRPSWIVREATGTTTATTESVLGSSDTDRAADASVTLARQLRGDLDDIVLKAMRTIPDHRYSSAEHLSEDLRRHLSGFPVLARRGGASYRLNRFLVRNWVPVAAAISALFVLTAFAVSTAVQSSRVARERDQAVRERDEKEQVLALMEDVFRMADPNEGGGQKLTVEEALDRSASGVPQRLAGQPAVEARLRHTIGTIYLNLGLLEAAQSHLERSLAIRRTLYGADSLEAAEGLSALGAVLREDGVYEEAERLTRAAVEIARERAGAEHPSLLGSLNNLVTLHCYRGQYDAAEAPSIEALDLARQHFAEASPQLTSAVNNRAVVLHRLGEPEQASTLYREALKLQRLARGDAHPDIGNLLNNLGIVLKEEGDFPGAIDAHRKALALRQEIYGGKHMTVAQSWTNLASVLRRADRKAEALAAYRQGLEILSVAHGPAHPLVARVSIETAALMVDEESAAAAEAWLQPALEVWRHALRARPVIIARAESILGLAMHRQGRHADGAPLLERSFSVLEENLGIRDRRTRSTLDWLIELYDASDAADAAEKKEGYQRRRAELTSEPVGEGAPTST